MWTLHPPSTGASISGSFLFLIGVANSITLYKVIKRRRSVSCVSYEDYPATLLALASTAGSGASSSDWARRG